MTATNLEKQIVVRVSSKSHERLDEYVDEHNRYNHGPSSVTSSDIVRDALKLWLSLHADREQWLAIGLNNEIDEVLARWHEEGEVSDHAAHKVGTEIMEALLDEIRTRSSIPGVYGYGMTKKLRV